MNDVVFNVVP